MSDVREPPAGSAGGHWQAAWRAGQAHSWDQETATASLNILQDSGFAPDQSVIDVGGGDSPLAGDLLQRGARDVTVLDISTEALHRARARMGPVSR